MPVLGVGILLLKRRVPSQVGCSKMYLPLLLRLSRVFSLVNTLAQKMLSRVNAQAPVLVTRPCFGAPRRPAQDTLLPGPRCQSLPVPIRTSDALRWVFRVEPVGRAPPAWRAAGAGGIPASAGMTGWINDGGSGHGKEAAVCVACPAVDQGRAPKISSNCSPWAAPGWSCSRPVSS